MKTMNVFEMMVVPPPAFRQQIVETLDPALNTPDMLRSWLRQLPQGIVAGRVRDAYDCVLARFYRSLLMTLEPEAFWQTAVAGGTLCVGYKGKEGVYQTHFALSTWAYQLVQLVDQCHVEEGILYGPESLALLHEAVSWAAEMQLRAEAYRISLPLLKQVAAEPALPVMKVEELELVPA